jgi:putative cell wall-binding protein
MNRLPSIRRWGVAALTGVTLFGGLSIVGAGVASAATAPTVTAAVTATAATDPGSGAGTAANITLTVNGTTLPGDAITLTLACPTTGTASFTALTNSDANFNAPVITNENTSTGACSTATFVVKAGGGEVNPVLNLSAIATLESGVSSQPLSISGTYSTLGLAATSFTVPTAANVVWYGITANTPAVTLPATGTTGISPISITDPAAIPTGYQVAGVTTGVASAVTNVTSIPGGTVPSEPTPIANPALGLADSANNVVKFTNATTAITGITATGLPTGMSLTGTTGASAIGANPTVTLTGTPTTSGSYTVVVTAAEAGSTTAATATFTVLVSPATVTLTLTGANDTWGGSPTISAVGAAATVATAGNVMTITVTNEPSTGNAALWTINGASVVTSSSAVGAQNVAVAYHDAAGGATMFSGVSIGSILGNVTTVYGADGTADGTVAAEFENAYPANAGSQTGGNVNVVLATDAPSANGSDALAASYLEGTLHTGLLITPSTSLGADAQQAIQTEGVTTVYVVGGPLAITPAVIAQIKALPSYYPGGLVARGSNVTVVGPIYGADGTAAGTAAAIATQYGTAYGAGSFGGSYSASGGAYNDTTGSASVSGPTSAVPTAIVVASSDWQDAMSIAPEAFSSRFPVILTGPSTSTTLGADASAALTSLGVKQVIIIGGQLALQNSVEAQIAALNGGISVMRIAGIDATDTAAQIANFAYAASGTGLGWTAAAGNHAVLASHVDYWTDALGAAALGGGANATIGFEPIVLVENPTTVGQYTTAEMPKLGALGVTNLTVLGGPLAMPSATVQSLLAGL